MTPEQNILLDCIPPHVAEIQKNYPHAESTLRGLTRICELINQIKHLETRLVNENPVLPKTDRRGILEAAIQYVTKDRNATHGNPEDNFKIIAAYWQTYLESIGVFKHYSDDYTDKYGTRNLEPADVAAMMILMKTSRLATSPLMADHWVDIAGYAACGGEIATKLPANGPIEE